jgi:uncharacterized protein (TIGR02996 family)
MSEQAALLRAIVAHPDDDTPRLVYADWLDENAPDKLPSPAAGPSARAEYIRVQCRLARRPFDDPEYPELLEREADLAQWLLAHAKDESRPPLPDGFRWYCDFDNGPGGTYARGFPEETEYADYEDDPAQNVENIVAGLPQLFAACTARTLRLEDAYGKEVAGVVRAPVVAGLRGLVLADLAGEDDDVALRGLAESPHLGGLRRLELEFPPGPTGLEWLAEAKSLDGLTSFMIDSPGAAGLRLLAGARWFRNLRSLTVWADGRDEFKAVAELPAMPNLVELTVAGDVVPTAVAARALAASRSFPRLARLQFEYVKFSPEHVALLAGARWPLRHLQLKGCAVGGAGAEALADAAFADSLRVLELEDCAITAGGVQALAASAKLAGLKHLDLSFSPVGRGGLMALARSPRLRGLRSLSLFGCNQPKAPLAAADVLKFLAALDAPELRHLDLARLPVGTRGARALAAGGLFANLTRLNLSECGLREGGARAIVESDALPHLTWLDLSDNAAGKGVSKLADPRVHPRLGHADVSRNRIPAPVLARLRKRPGVRL